MTAQSAVAIAFASIARGYLSTLLRKCTSRSLLLDVPLIQVGNSSTVTVPYAPAIFCILSVLVYFGQLSQVIALKCFSSCFLSSVFD